MKIHAIVVIILLCLSSGCLQMDDKNPSEDEENNQDDLIFEDSDYIECMMHEDLERCWNVFVPSTVNSSGAPMIIDLHGNTLTMQNQRNLSDFDDIASRGSE